MLLSFCLLILAFILACLSQLFISATCAAEQSTVVNEDSWHSVDVASPLQN